MCSRYELKPSAREFLSCFGMTVPPPWPNRDEVRPTDAALILTPGGAGHLSRWGLSVDWDTKPLINARAETLSQRAAFRRLLQRGRILVPASAWWEWRAEADGRTRTKMRLYLPARPIFAFAGLSDGQRFVIVTTAAAPQIASVHHRMPVVLPVESHAAWLDPTVGFGSIAEALAPTRDVILARPDTPPASKPAQGDLFS